MLTVYLNRSLIRAHMIENKRGYQESVHSHLHAMNELFLKVYQEKKTAIKRSLGQTQPVILILGDELILRYQGTRKTIRYVSDEYHEIKSIAHQAGVIDSLHWLEVHEPEKADLWRKNRHVLREHLICLKQELEEKKYEGILEKYLVCLEKPGSLSTLSNDLNAMIEEAAILRLDGLHRSMDLLKQEVAAGHWQQLSVVVLGPRMPREGELSMQYYRAMGLQESSSLCPYNNKEKCSNKLIYAESIEDEETALDLLVTELADEDLGKGIFGDCSKMHGDLLKEATAKHLTVLFPNNDVDYKS